MQDKNTASLRVDEQMNRWWKLMRKIRSSNHDWCNPVIGDVYRFSLVNQWMRIIYWRLSYQAL